VLPPENNLKRFAWKFIRKINVKLWEEGGFELRTHLTTEPTQAELLSKRIAIFLGENLSPQTRHFLRKSFPSIQTDHGVRNGTRFRAEKGEIPTGKVRSNFPSL